MRGDARTKANRREGTIGATSRAYGIQSPPTATTTAQMHRARDCDRRRAIPLASHRYRRERDDGTERDERGRSSVGEPVREVARLRQHGERSSAAEHDDAYDRASHERSGGDECARDHPLSRPDPDRERDCPWGHLGAERRD